jgi:exodeoxyribonuclease VII large subunit
VSAVGHEIDVTLSDLAADVRALTPSEAAERVVPASEEISGRIRAYQQRLRHATHRRAMWLRARFDGILGQRPFRRPFELVHERSRFLDELSVRGNASIQRMMHDYAGELATIAGKIDSLSPLAVLARGYTITQDAKSRIAVREAKQLRVGQSIVTRFSSGEAMSTIDSINPDQS